MNKKSVLFSLIFVIFIIFILSTKTYATDTDQITNYVVTVDPRMNDGSLDITYEITWKVLSTEGVGPLTWVQIGTPNSNFDNPTALTSNIKSISKYNGSYVKIVFKNAYAAGQTVTFKYSIHQSYMYKISFGSCKYEFTPAWFTDIKVDNMTIKWNKDKVKKSNTKTEEGNYFVWYKTNLDKGEKVSVEIKYDKDSFSALNTSKQSSSNSSSSGSFGGTLMIIIIIIFIFSSIGGSGGGYYRHRGFYGGFGPRYYGGCVRSSCACAHSSCASSCACACAGSGRAGCSKKDFYGTNLNAKKIRKAFTKE